MGKAARLRNRQRYLDRVNAEERVRAGVPVFYEEQDVPHGFLTHDECLEKKAVGMGKFINRGKGFRLYRAAPAPPPPEPSDSGNSGASIAVNEMRANVGEPPSEPGAALTRGTVRRAQEKIRAIGRQEIGSMDTKAPLAFKTRDHTRAPALAIKTRHVP
jgi:hypothetical protein